MEIKFDSQAGAWTDGTNYVKTKIIRQWSQKEMGKPFRRGRLTNEEVLHYWIAKVVAK